MEINKLNELVEQYIAPIFGIQFNIGAVPPIPEPHDVDIWRHVSTPYLLGNSDSYLFSGLYSYYLRSAIQGLLVRASSWEGVHLTYPNGPLYVNEILDMALEDWNIILPMRDLIKTLTEERLWGDEPLYGLTASANIEEVINYFDSGTVFDIYWEWSVYNYITISYSGAVSFNNLINFGGRDWLIAASDEDASPIIAPFLTDSKLIDEVTIVLQSSLMSLFPSMTGQFNEFVEDPEGNDSSFIAFNAGSTHTIFDDRPSFDFQTLSASVGGGGGYQAAVVFTDYACALFILAYLQLYNITTHDANWEHRVLVQLAFDEENRIGRDNASKLNTFYTQSLGNTVIGLNRAELKKVASQYSEAASNRLEEIYQKVETLSPDKFDLLRRVFDKNPHLMLSLFNGL